MRALSRPSLLLMALLLPVGLAAAGELPGGLRWDDSAEKVDAALQEQCRTSRRIEVTPPRFPLAARREEHFLCLQLQGALGQVTALAFVVADDRLVFIEGRGGAVAAFGQGDGHDLMHYRVLDDGERFVDVAGDAVWFLSGPARHPNIYTWSDPLLSADALPPYAQSAAIPPMLGFGESLATLLPGFEQDCPLLQVEPDQYVWLPHGPAEQVQVNCFGYEYAGFPRRIEAVFGDDSLEVVWILTGQGEEDRVRTALRAAFGPPERVGERWEVFAAGRVGLRKDKPEVLLLSQRMVPYYADELAERE